MVDEDFLPMAFDMPGGYGAYAFGLRMVSRRRGTLRQCSLATDWDDFIIPGSFDDREAFCWLGTLPIPRRQVLSERIMNSLKFHCCGDMVEGVISAHGSMPIPEAYRHGRIVPFTMTFLDQWGNEIRHDGKLYVDRTWEAKYVRPGRRPVSSLREPMPSNADFRPNLTCGPVRDTTAEMLKRMERKEAEPESELFASLKRALSQLRQEAAAEAGKQPKKPGDKVD